MKVESQSKWVRTTDISLDEDDVEQAILEFLDRRNYPSRGVTINIDCGHDVLREVSVTIREEKDVSDL